MKKHSNKSSKNPKTKIELKIKSKTVTNNFILTPRTVSPRDAKEIRHKSDKNDDIKSDKHRYQENISLRTGKDSKNNQYRRSITDHTKVQGKKKFEEDQTGTHTPQVKRMTHTQDGFNKKKSTHSLFSSDRNRRRKKNDEKLSKNLSGELSTGTFQRIIGIIIKDYKEGKLKEKQLEQTLIELFDRKEKKILGKKKRKETHQEPFSNQFLRSATRHTRSQALTRKRKSSYEDQKIQERVLERQGFVNKIIVKGITTSMFLKDEDFDSYLKESKSKIPLREPNFDIHTSNSVRQINEEMRLIQEQYQAKINGTPVYTYEDMMASKIQRAWRRYRTRKLLSHNTFSRTNPNAINILDEFTDEEVIQQTNSPIDELKICQRGISPLNYQQLTQIILKNLQEKTMSKQDCLKNILGYLNGSQADLQLQFSPKINQECQSSQIEIQEVKSDVSSGEEILESRVKPLEIPIVSEKLVLDHLQQSPSNELEMNSFTNKYSSKENVDNTEYFKAEQVQQQHQIVDNSSLTFVHSQTVANQTFKSINIQNIEDALQTRQQGLNHKKQRETEELTQKLLGNKITKEDYLKQKGKIDKWYKSQLKQLKKVKQSLIESCNQACKVLEVETGKLQSDKSSKMMKCLSEEYIKNRDWTEKVKTVKRCCRISTNRKRQIDEDQDIRTSSLSFKDTQKYQEEDDTCLIVNSKKKTEEEDEAEIMKKFEMSPKLNRLEDQTDDITDYKYEEVQRIIEEQEEALQEGLINFNTIHHQNSDKYDVCCEQDEIEAQEISLINNFVNEPNKFKYLCQEDKEDIFEFLFLDLVLEMFTETITGQNKILKAAQVYISKGKRLKRIPKGIKTTIASSKQYLGVLTKYILNQKNGLKNLSHPMGPSAVQMLKYMRDEIVETDEEEAISSTLVLGIDVFEKVSRLPQLELKLEKYYEDQEKQHNRLSFLKTALNINNKSLFDSLNENLDHERPYGVWGKPFPWKKVLSLDRKWGSGEEESKLKKAIQKTVENCSYLCGILVDKEDSLFGSHRVSEEYVMQIREDRLSKMLANELIENEERWIFYDDQQTQILMDVSSYVTKKLIKEFVLQIDSIKLKF